MNQGVAVYGGGGSLQQVPMQNRYKVNHGVAVYRGGGSLQQVPMQNR